MDRTTLYLTFSPDIELEITVQAREFNGMDSDPKVRLREPRLEELHGCLAAVRAGNFRFFKELDFPVEGGGA